MKTKWIVLPAIILSGLTFHVSQTSLTNCQAQMVRATPAPYADDRGASRLMEPELGANATTEPRSLFGSGSTISALTKLKLKSGVYSSLDRSHSPGDSETLPIGTLNFRQADIPSVLKAYEMLSGRNVIKAGNLKSYRISFRNETPLTRREALQTLDTTLSQNEVVMVYQGEKSVKAVARAQAPMEAPPACELALDELPESETYLSYSVVVKNGRAGDFAKALQPLAKMPNSILAVDAANLLVLRDYSANVRRMLKMLQTLDQPRDR